jgi:hypothetical protein
MAEDTGPPAENDNNQRGDQKARNPFKDVAKRASRSKKSSHQALSPYAGKQRSVCHRFDKPSANRTK